MFSECQDEVGSKEELPLVRAGDGIVLLPSLSSSPGCGLGQTFRPAEAWVRQSQLLPTSRHGWDCTGNQKDWVERGGSSNSGAGPRLPGQRCRAPSRRGEGEEEVDPTGLPWPALHPLHILLSSPQAGLNCLPPNKNRSPTHRGSCCTNS